jgi:peptide/nickel transport system substrate-binding protein
MSNERKQEKVLEIDLRQFTRREVLQLLGVGAATAALAACGGSESSGGSGGGTAPTAGTSGQAASTKKGGAINGGTNLELPPAGHHNWYVPKVIGNDFWAELEHLSPTWYLWKDDKYVGTLAEKWGFVGGDAFELTLKPNLKWSNGQALAAKDVVATWTLNRLFNNQMFRYVDRFEAKDERTVSFHMSKPATVVERYVLRSRIRPASIWGEWADKLTPLYAAGKDNTADEVKAVRGEFEKFRPTERLASGPYMMDLKSLTEASVEFVKNPSGVNADVARFDRIKLYVGETPVSTPLVLSKEIDFSTNGFAVATDKQMQAQGIRVLRTPIHGGPAIHFNLANPKLKVFTDKRARQALAYAVKREDNAIVSLGESAKAVQYMAGFSDNLVPRWVDQADLGKLNKYSHDPNKATELLQAVGCRKQGNQWIDPEGRPMEYEVMCPAEFQDWSASVQDWADQVTKFGIKMAVRALTFTQVPIERREGRFELAYDGWGTGNPHPSFSFVTTLLSKVQPLANGPYIAFDLKQKSELAGDVDFQQLIDDSALGLDINAQKANVTKAALALNDLLPVIPIWERYGNGPALTGTRVTGWPADGDPILENTLYNDSFTTILIYDGRLGPA